MKTRTDKNKWHKKLSTLFSAQNSELTYLLNYIGNEDSHILKFIDFFSWLKSNTDAYYKTAVPLLIFINPFLTATDSDSFKLNCTFSLYC